MVDPESGLIHAKKLDDDGLTKGKVHELNAIGALGLVLIWHRTRGACSRNLKMLFEQTSTPMYMWLIFSRKFLLHVLSRDSDSKVSLPTVDDVRFDQSAIGEKYPLCHDIWGATDGLKLLIQSSEDEAKQIFLTDGRMAITLTLVLYLLHTEKYMCTYLTCQAPSTASKWLTMGSTKQRNMCMTKLW